MTDRPILFSGPMVRAILAGTKAQTRRVMKPQPRVRPEFDEETSSWVQFDGDRIACSVRVLYASGDRLWVRETWADDEQFGGIIYRADHKGDDPIGNGWRSSIHMPRIASRLTLTVTDVRVQRLQDISPDDVRAEGVEIPWHHIGDLHDPHRWKHDHFRPLWDSINGKKPVRTWADNPWVVAVSFRPELRNIDSPDHQSRSESNKVKPGMVSGHRS